MSFICLLTGNKCYNYFSPKKDAVDGHTSRVFACAFNPRSHHELISGGWDDKVMCWDDRQPFATKYFKGIHMCGEGLDFDKPGRQVSIYFGIKILYKYNFCLMPIG